MTSAFYPVILSGGSGSRLWPLSRRGSPKQFLALASGRTLFEDTLARIRAVPGAGAPIVVGAEAHRFLIAEQLAGCAMRAEAIVLEPVGRNTAPAAAVAALYAVRRDPQSVLALLPSDHVVRDAEALRRALAMALPLAAAGYLVTFGIAPRGPATAFGYIERGEPLEQHGALRVRRFVEKPDRETAARYLASGNYFWNSGMFVFSAEVFLRELARLREDILTAARAALDRARPDRDFLRLAEEPLRACPSDSIDVAVMEKTDRAAVLPVDIGWDDAGSWASLWEIEPKDARDNAVRGDVILADARGCYARAEQRLLALLAVRDLIVVETADAVLVADRSRAEEVKALVEQLVRAGRPEAIEQRRVYRPWGYYESVDRGERYQVKRIMVKPGEALSLQMHHRRAEHWVVVSGRARVRRDAESFELGENQSTYIPPGTRHRLENPGPAPLYLIEVQSGDYLGEDDIVRFEDRYGRAGGD